MSSTSDITHPPPLRPDPWSQRVIILALSATVMLGVGGTIALAWTGREPPSLLASLAATALGALSGLASASRRGGASLPNGGSSESAIMRR